MNEQLNEHYTIPLPPVTKKNSSQIIFTGAKCPVCKRGRLARLLPSKKYREYEDVRAALLGDHEAAKRLTDAGVKLWNFLN